MSTTFLSRLTARPSPTGPMMSPAPRAVVSVGISHDTAEFAVESIRRWWHTDGAPLYRTSPRLLICADGGGSNGSPAPRVETAPAKPRERDHPPDYGLSLSARDKQVEQD